MREIIFQVVEDTDGTYCASWDDPRGGGISTQGSDLAELQAMVRDAVLCHFDDGEAPRGAVTSEKCRGPSAVSRKQEGDKAEEVGHWEDAEWQEFAYRSFAAGYDDDEPDYSEEDKK